MPKVNIFLSEYPKNFKNLGKIFAFFMKAPGHLHEQHVSLIVCVLVRNVHYYAEKLYEFFTGQTLVKLRLGLLLIMFCDDHLACLFILFDIAKLTS